MDLFTLNVVLTVETFTSLAETKGLDFVDKEKAKLHAQENAHRELGFQ